MRLRAQLLFALSALLSVTVLLFLHAGLPAAAQSVETIHKFEADPHIGAPEEALVGLIVTNRADDGSVQIRHGNGIFIRCDGFR